MIIRANIKEAFRSLTSSKQRTLLALIGIIIGIASVIAMVSIGTIVKTEVLNQFKDLGIDTITINRDIAASDEGAEFTVRDAMELVSGTRAVTLAAPYSETGTITSYAGAQININLMGVTGSFKDINKLRAAEGRFISDLDENSYFCVLGASVAEQLRVAGAGDIVGGKFKFGEHLYTVVGVLDTVPTGSGMRPYGINEGVIMHLTTSLRAFANKRIGTIMARTSGAMGSEEIREELNTYFGSRVNGLSVMVETAEELIAKMEQQMRLLTLLLGAIGSISLIVGGVGVMNVMLVSVSERRKEIGIRRAIGAQQGDIQAQFIIESVMLCFVGGMIGIVAGVGVSYIVARASEWEFMVSYAAVILGMGVSTFVGVFFGYYPSRQASRLDPIAALRN